MEEQIFTINHQPITVTLRDQADESVAAEIFRLREYRVAEEIITAAKLPIVDVGAHAGFFTLYARALNATVPIVAIEPETKNLEALENHVVQNNITNVTVIKGVLASTKGERELVISEDSHNHTLILGKTAKTQTVPSYTLASLKEYFPDGISLVKMDIEGGEYEIFEKLPDEDFALIHAIVMEYHDLPNHKHGEIEQQLREHGFGVQIFPSKFDKSMGFLWATNKRI